MSRLLTGKRSTVEVLKPTERKVPLNSGRRDFRNSSLFNPYKAGGQFGFSKNGSSTERMEPCFSVAFNIIISHIVPENFIKIPKVF